MSEKENARRAWKTERAHVRKHDQIVARKMTSRECAAWFAAGALASCAAFAAILWLWVVPAMDAALAAVQGALA